MYNVMVAIFITLIGELPDPIYREIPGNQKRKTKKKLLQD